MTKKSLDGVLVKKAYKQESFTEHDVQELAKCADLENGYLHFVTNYFYIQHPVKGKMRFAPYDYQLKLMESYHNHRYSINMCPRQSGKCVTGDATIHIKNPDTHEEFIVPIDVFYEYNHAKQLNKPLPCLTKFKINNDHQ